MGAKVAHLRGDIGDAEPIHQRQHSAIECRQCPFYNDVRNLPCTEKKGIKNTTRGYDFSRSNALLIGCGIPMQLSRPPLYEEVNSLDILAHLWYHYFDR